MKKLEKPFRKNPIQKSKKKPVRIKKPLERKRIFVQTPFSHSTLKLERKNFTLQNLQTTRFFAPLPVSA